MMSRVASTASIRPVWRRFRHNRRGSAAVEFALVAPVFFALLFAILETGIIFFADQTLESITQAAARTILTGQTQSASYTQQQFHDDVVCPSGGMASILFSCSPTGIYIDVRSYPSSFSNISINSEIVGGVFNSGDMQYNPGTSCNVVVVRLFYQWPQIVTGLGYNITNLNNGTRLLVATAAFRNEPWSGPCTS